MSGIMQSAIGNFRNSGIIGTFLVIGGGGGGASAWPDAGPPSDGVTGGSAGNGGNAGNYATGSASFLKGNTPVLITVTVGLGGAGAWNAGATGEQSQISFTSFITGSTTTATGGTGGSYPPTGSMVIIGGIYYAKNGSSGASTAYSSGGSGGLAFMNGAYVAPAPANTGNGGGGGYGLSNSNTGGDGAAGGSGKVVISFPQSDSSSYIATGTYVVFTSTINGIVYNNFQFNTSGTLTIN